MREDRIETLQYLRDFTVQLSDDIGLGTRDNNGRLILPDAKLYGEYTKLLARCHVELGQWQAALRENNDDVSFARSSTSSKLIEPVRPFAHSERLLRCHRARSRLVPSLAYMGIGQLRGHHSA